MSKVRKKIKWRGLRAYCIRLETLLPKNFEGVRTTFSLELNQLFAAEYFTFNSFAFVNYYILSR